MERSGVCLRGLVSEYTYRRASLERDYTPLIGTHHYQTPTATQYTKQQGYTGPPRYSINERALRGELYIGQTIRGHVDPQFVEWIQGFPMDWTNI